MNIVAEKVFGVLPPSPPLYPMMSRNRVKIGPTVLPRLSSSASSAMLRLRVAEPQMKVMNTLALALNMNWLSIIVSFAALFH